MSRQAVSAHPCKRLLAELFEAAVGAARGADLLSANSHVRDGSWHYTAADGPLSVTLPRMGRGRVLVLGAGKAAASLADGLERSLGDRVAGGVVVVKHGHGQALRRIRVMEGAHPIPDLASVAATRELLRTLATATDEDTVFFVLTGGASALLVEPAAGLSLADVQVANRLLVNGGAQIEEINAVRKHLSAVSGGRLRQQARCAVFCTLAISDVLGDSPAVIGSGPTVADSSTFQDALAVVERYDLQRALPAAVVDHLQRGAAGLIEETPKASAAVFRHSLYRIIASNRQSLDACARLAGDRGFGVEILTTRMHGHTHAAARQFADALRAAAAERSGGPPLVLLAGGETTLAVAGEGRGGRNQEFALVAARELQDVPNIALLSAGTDGTDGPTDAAGAFVDGSTFARARTLGLDPHDALRRHDSYPLLQALGDLHLTGPTGTNVMDLVIGLVH